MEWEIELMTLMQSLASDALTSVNVFFSLFGEEMLLILILGFIYWCVDKETGRFLALGLSVAMLFGAISKNLVMRRRPYFDHPEIKPMRAPSGRGDVMDMAAQGYSFPSMHSANSSFTFGAMAMNTRRNPLRVLFIMIPLLTGISRPYLGAHYPTDVLAGWALGLLVLFGLNALLKKTRNYLLIALVVAAATLPGWFFCKSADFFVSYGLLLGMCVGIWLDDRFFKFENTRNPFRSILRLAVGMALFMGIEKALGTVMPMKVHFFAALKYFLTSAISFGLYPAVFKYFDGIFEKGQKK